MLPPLSERQAVSLREGSTDVLTKMMKEEGVPTMSAFLRILIERGIQNARPADFARLRGVG